MARLFFYNDFTRSAAQTAERWGLPEAYNDVTNIEGALQIGTDTDWKDVGACRTYTEGWLGVKAGGGLYAVGSTYLDNTYGIPGLDDDVFEITPLGNSVPFAKIYSPGYGVLRPSFILQSTDNSFYAFGQDAQPPYIGTDSVDPLAEPVPLPEITAGSNPVVDIAAAPKYATTVYVGGQMYWAGQRIADTTAAASFTVGDLGGGSNGYQTTFETADFDGTPIYLSYEKDYSYALLDNGDLVVWTYYYDETFTYTYGKLETIATGVTAVASGHYETNIFWLDESGHLYQYAISWDVDESGEPFIDSDPAWLIDDSRAYDQVYVDENAYVAVARDATTKELYKFDMYGIVGDPVPELVEEGLQVGKVVFIGSGSPGSAMLLVEYEPEDAKTQFWTSLVGTYQE